MGIGVPTAGGLMRAAKDYGYGLAGGAISSLVSGFVGSRWGVLGTLVGPILAGTVLKGDEGRIISTTLGVFAGMQLLNGLSSGGSTSFPEVM